MSDCYSMEFGKGKGNGNVSTKKVEAKIFQVEKKMKFEAED